MPGRKHYRKEFTVRLGPDDRLRYRIQPGRGQVDDFVVQYEARIDDRFYPVVRYDCSHGRAHKDTLSLGGRNVEKEWLENRGLDDALQIANQDLRSNWPQYRDEFIRRMP